MLHINNHLASRNINFKSEKNSLFTQLERIDNDRDALLFIKKQQDILSPVDEKGNHIIHIITRKGFYETIKQLLINPKRAQELLNLRGEDGKTPLAMSPSEKISKLMLSKGAQAYALDDNLRPAALEAVVPKEVKEHVEQRIEAMPQVKEQIKEVVATVAETEYAKVEEPAPITEPIAKEKPKKSYFSMFTPKPKTEEVKPEESTKPAEVSETEVQKEEKKGITIIEGTEAFQSLNIPEIPNLDAIVGLDKVKNALRTSIVEPVTNEVINKEFNQNKTSIPNGLLLVAPPGNGKTALVRGLAAEAGMSAFEVKNISEMANLIPILAKGFEKTKQRSIIYMRGLDNLYEQGNPTGELTNQILSTLNDTAKRGILVIFSAECPENLPKSILTPGKIDRILSFKSPDYNARLEFIKHYAKDRELLNSLDSEEIANKTQGFSIAQIKHVLNDALIFAITTDRETVTTEDLLERIKIFSKEQDIPEINEYNKTSMYDTFQRRYQPTEYDAKDFESIAGMPATKSSVEESILKPWLNADKLRQAKIQLPAGGVFAGDPGTSKTYMAKAIARSLNIPLYVLKMSDIGSSYLHETSKNIGRIVDQLIEKFDETGEASVLLIDEIDHFQKEHSQSGAEEVNTLLQEIERGRNKILFIGTTNELESLPDSLTRDGRMGTVIHFEHCDAKAAKAIIKNMLSERNNNPQIDAIVKDESMLDTFAKRCNGMVASSISAIVNDALAEFVINGTNLSDAFDSAIRVRKKKDIEKMLSQNSKTAGHRLNITEDSTIMYDTRYSRMQMTDSDPQNLDDLGGMDEVKEVLQSEIIDVYSPETLQLLKENRLPITKGFILHGPPGNGKTTIIKAVANQMGLPIYPLNSGNIGSSYIHQLAKNAQEVREQLAYKYKMTGERSILFMDEAQQLVPKTSGAMMAHQHNVEETNFFKDMIMTAEQDGIIYAMATNDLDQIEPAFYENADRLGVCVYVGDPDLQSRLGIIKKLLDDRPVTKEINTPDAIEALAIAFAGLSISKISQTILNIIRNSIKSKTPITLENALAFVKKAGVKG